MEGDMKCEKCGEIGKKILIPLYVREDGQKFYKKKLYCIDCFLTECDNDGHSRSDEDNDNGDDEEFSKKEKQGVLCDAKSCKFNVAGVCACKEDVIFISWAWSQDHGPLFICDSYSDKEESP